MEIHLLGNELCAKLDRDFMHVPSSLVWWDMLGQLYWEHTLELLHYVLKYSPLLLWDTQQMWYCTIWQVRVTIQQLLKSWHWAPTPLDQLTMVRGSLQNLPCSFNIPTVPAGTGYLCLNPLHHRHMLDNKGSLPPYGPWGS